MLVNQNNSKPKLLMKDLFSLRNKHNNDKVEFSTQTVDRKGGDFSIIIKYDNHEFKASDDLYNYIVSRQKDLRNYSDVKDFRETELKPISANKMQFSLGYRTFELEVIKEVV